MTDPGSIDSFINLGKQLGAAGFGTICFLLLIGNYYGKVIWGPRHDRDMSDWQIRFDIEVTEWKYRLEEKSKECEQWKSAFLRSMGHTDKALELVKPSARLDGLEPR